MLYHNTTSRCQAPRCCGDLGGEMSRGPRPGVAGAFYHVMSRGNEKQNIYRCSNDKEKFLGYLKSASKNYNAVIHCYCLIIV